MSRSVARLLVLLSPLVFAAACGGTPPQPRSDAGVDAGGDEVPPDAGGVDAGEPDAGGGIASIEVMPDPSFICLNGCRSFTAGQSRAFVAVAKDAADNELEDVSFAWTTTDPTVASVDEYGMVTSYKAGVTRVRATAGDLSGEAEIYVAPARVARIVVTPNPATVEAGETVQLSAVAYDDWNRSLDDVVFVWKSTNPAGATVDAAGLVTGVRGGRVAIFAGSDRGFDPGWATVEVKSDVPRPAGFGLSDVSLGPAHGCGLDPGGVIWCWGINYYGELGLGHRDPPYVGYPSPERVDTTQTFDSVAMGGGHSCALTGTGEAWCWGLNDEGQLGSPHAVGGVNATASPVLGGLQFESLASGGGHTCGITRTDRKLYCWGSGRHGALGTGDAMNRPTPAAVDSTLAFTRVAARGGATCALDDSGKAWCFGRNRDGVLGTAEAPDDSIQHFSPEAVYGDHVFTDLALTGSHVCALDSAGAAWCWGDSTYGQLGDGRTLGDGRRVVSSIPQQVITPERFSKVVAGSLHSCGLKSNGEVYCWGNNEYGQLGDGTLTTSSVPVKVLGGLAFTKVVASGLTTCGITASGEGYCWGSGDIGETASGALGGLSVEPWPMAMPDP